MSDFLTSLPIPRLDSKARRIREKKAAPTEEEKALATRAKAKAKVAATNTPAKAVTPTTPPRHSLDAYSPESRVTYVGTQICPDCGMTTRYIAGDLIRFIKLDKIGGTVTTRTRAFAAVDSRFSNLPRKMIHLDAETCACPSCVGLSITFDDALDGHVQLPLPMPDEAFPTHHAVRVEAGVVARIRAARAWSELSATSEGDENVA